MTHSRGEYRALIGRLRTVLAVLRRVSAACAMSFALVLPAFVSAADGVPTLVPGTTITFEIDLPNELRDFDRSGQRTSATRAQVAVAAPVDFDPDRQWPVLLISAGSEPGANSSRRLLEHYKQAALLAGWVIVAADPSPAVAKWQDNVSLRFVLDLLAVEALHAAWTHAGTAPIAFAGLGGGARFAAVLSSMFASQHSVVIGVYQAGFDEESFRNPAMQFQVLLDDQFLRMPIYLHGGASDASPSAARLHVVQQSLEDAGFKNIRLAFADGSNPADPDALRLALNWFGSMARLVAWPNR